jgi:hypothetical protein
MNKRSIAPARALVIVSGLVLGLTAPPAAHAATTWWWVDCAAAGNGNGTSQSSAWNNLASVNAHTFQAGDGIVFARGTTCHGQLALRGSGSSGKPILIGQWTSGHGSATPILAGDGVARQPSTCTTTST